MTPAAAAPHAVLPIGRQNDDAFWSLLPLRPFGHIFMCQGLMAHR